MSHSLLAGLVGGLALLLVIAYYRGPGPATVETAAGRTVVPSPSRSLEGAVGSEGPGLLEAMAPDGRWLVVCQARADTNGDGLVSVSLGRYGEPIGDTMRPYLIRRGRPEVALTRFIGSDPAERFVVARQDDAVVLFDTLDGDDRVLWSRGADTSEECDDRASFDAAGQSCLLVMRRATVPRLVMCSMSSGTQSTMAPGPGSILRADLSRDGQWIVVEVVGAETSGNGVVGVPHEGPCTAAQATRWCNSRPDGVLAG